MDAQLKSFEFGALLIEAQAVTAEVEGMKAENAQRAVLGQSVAFDEYSFLQKASELRGVAETIRGLARQ